MSEYIPIIVLLGIAVSMVLLISGADDHAKDYAERKEFKRHVFELEKMIENGNRGGKNV